MRLVLDLSAAVIRRDGALGGVVARVGDASATVAFGADDCALDPGGGGMPCGEEVVCQHQAWLAVVLVTGESGRRPTGDGVWDAATRTLSFPLLSGRRRTFS